MDEHDQLAALVTRDAEFDRFEAVREGYQQALGDFVAAASRDSSGALEEMSTKLRGRVTGTLAITGATLIDGLGNPPVSNATVVTSGGRILAAGPSANVKIPAGATRIDARGKYIIPGLWDMHAHYEQAEWGPIYLAAGVTTARDVGNEFKAIAAIRDAIQAGKGLGPRLFLAGIVDGDSQSAIGIERVNTAEDAAAWVKKYHDAGFSQMKIYSSVKPEIVKAVCEDAHAVGMTVTGHIPRGMTVVDGVNAGMDQVNHISYLMEYLVPLMGTGRGMAQRLEAVQALDVNSEAVRKLIDFLKQHGTVIDDTLALYELGTRAFDEPASIREPGIDRIAPELREPFEGMGGQGDALVYRKAAFEKGTALLEALHRAGIPIVAGTDQAVPGYSVYREIEIYVKAGFTPMEAIQAATMVPARALGAASDSGTIESGKRADLDILDANPLADIRNIRKVNRVVANGILYDPAPLWAAVGFR
jgi:imidazolonepropionase-like amidohydrolase